METNYKTKDIITVEAIHKDKDGNIKNIEILEVEPNGRNNNKCRP